MSEMYTLAIKVAELISVRVRKCYICEKGFLSELCHVLEEAEWDFRSETLDSKGQSALQNMLIQVGHSLH